MCFHGPNVVSCEVVTGKRNPRICPYLPNYTLEHLLYMEEALARFREQELILLGDLNVDIQSHNPCSQKVTDFLLEFGMVNLHLSGTSRNIVAGKMLLDLWGRLAPLQNGGNKGCG